MFLAWRVALFPSRVLRRKTGSSTFAGMDEKTFRSKKKWAGEAVPSMKRRRTGHDYYGRCIYMVTLVVEGRRPLLGHIAGDGQRVPAVMHPSPLGQAVLDELRQITVHYPQVKVIYRQLMPDHLHFIIYVQERIGVHLSRVIAGYKTGCNRHYRAVHLAQHPTDTMPALWEQGFNDRILEGKGHLQRMMDYITDNPRRLAIKRHHPDYFKVQRDVQAGGYTFAAIGNTFLLQSPRLLPVQCTRKLTQQQIDETCDRFLLEAERGAILVSPSISKGEKAVMKAAFEHGYPVIYLQENGFAPLAKPGGARFAACAEGRLLILAPWPHHNRNLAITQDKCHALNDIARAICAGTLPPAPQP